MSVESLIHDVEAEAKKLNPAAIFADLDAAKLKIAEFESRIVQLETMATNIAPVMEAIVAIVAPNTAIPAEVKMLLSALPRPTLSAK